MMSTKYMPLILFLWSLIALSACREGEENSAASGVSDRTARALVQVGDETTPLGRYGGTYQDVKAITLKVTTDGAADETISLTDNGTVWKGTVNDLTTGEPYTFSAEAFRDNITKDNSTLIFRGVTEKVLEVGDNPLSLRLGPVEKILDNDTRFPQVLRMAYSKLSRSSENQTLELLLQAAVGDNLTYQFDYDNGSISPRQGLLNNLSAEYVTLTPTLTAPATPGEYLYTFQLRNQQGLGVRTQFALSVLDNVTLTPGILFNPVLLSLAAERENSTHIQWTAVVSDDLNLDNLSATWKFNSNIFSGGDRSVGADNVTFTTKMGYAETDQGDLTLELTNSQGDNTTISYAIEPRQFPLNLQVDPLQVPDRSIALGDNHTCALSSNNQVYCRGDNSTGQLGAGDWYNGWVLQTQLSGVKQISAGDNHTCALDNQSQVACWGDNNTGQLGTGVLSGYQLVRAGGDQSCGVLDNRTVTCWGASYGATPTASPFDSTVRDLDVGGEQACAILDNGSVACWDNATAHTLIDNLNNPTQISVGGSHACAVLDNGSAACWGKNNHYQLGDGTTDNSTSAVLVQNLAGIARIEAGGEHTCAILEDNRIRCWGRSDSAQTGSGQSDSPVTDPAMGFVGILRFNDVEEVSLGFNHSCLRRLNGELYCWGSNTKYKITYFSEMPVVEPTKITLPYVP